MDAAFDEQIERIECEELEPQGLTLLTRNLADGRSRFLVKDAETGAVCAMMDFSQSGMLETGTFEALENGLICGVAPASV